MKFQKTAIYWGILLALVTSPSYATQPLNLTSRGGSYFGSPAPVRAFLTIAFLTAPIHQHFASATPLYPIAPFPADHLGAAKNPPRLEQGNDRESYAQREFFGQVDRGKRKLYDRRLKSFQKDKINKEQNALPTFPLEAVLIDPENTFFEVLTSLSPFDDLQTTEDTVDQAATVLTTYLVDRFQKGLQIDRNQHTLAHLSALIRWHVDRFTQKQIGSTNVELIAEDFDVLVFGLRQSISTDPHLTKREPAKKGARPSNTRQAIKMAIKADLEDLLP